MVVRTLVAVAGVFALLGGYLLLNGNRDGFFLSYFAFMGLLVTAALRAGRRR